MRDLRGVNMDLQTQHTGVRALDVVKGIITNINRVVAEYRPFNKTDSEMIGAMAQTIVDQRNRLMILERKGRTT